MRDEQDLVIPLVEERAFVTKRNVETGRVRVATRVEEREQLIRGELARDEVEIRRVPRNVEIDSVPEIGQVGDVTIVPVVEEVLVVEKKLMLVEEIHLSRVRTSEEYAQPVTVRAQRAEIEREASSGDPQPIKENDSCRVP